jgi:hypothetical protein
MSIKAIPLTLMVLLAVLCSPAWADTAASSQPTIYFWMVLETLGANPEPIPNQPFVVNVSQKGNQADVRLEQYIYQKPGETPEIKMLDTLKLTMKPGQRLDGASCEVKGVPDPEIMFVTRRNSQTRLLSPTETTAWRTNRQTGKFERIQFDRSNTKCRNRFFGT